ncbi:MAG: hypothetical protein Q9227_007910 [Pyrenula ochraceoflavens]
MSSVPKTHHPPSYSSSPSRPSPKTQRSRSRGIHPSPHFDEPAAQNTISDSPGGRTLPFRGDAAAGLAEEHEHAIAESSELYEPEQVEGVEEDDAHDGVENSREFYPFFALVHDSTTNTTHHPTVHYVFADDEDADIVTEAALRSLEADDPEQKAHGTDSSQDETLDKQRQQSVTREDRTDEDQEGSAAATFRLRPPQENVKEHYLVVDIEPVSAPDAQPIRSPPSNRTASTPAAGEAVGGYTIRSSRSLSAQWQLLNCSLSQAPTFDNGAAPTITTASKVSPGGAATTSHTTPSSENLMLRVEGLGVGDPATTTTTAGKGGAGVAEPEEKESLEEKLSRLEKGLGEIRRVIELSNT